LTTSKPRTSTLLSSSNYDILSTDHSSRPTSSRPASSIRSSSQHSSRNPSSFRGLEHAATAKRLPKRVFSRDNPSKQSLAPSELSLESAEDQPDLPPSSPPAQTHATVQPSVESALHPAAAAAEPVVHPPPSPTASYASSRDYDDEDDEADQLPDLPNLSRMVDQPFREQWSSRLSTIHSESEIAGSSQGPSSNYEVHGPGGSQSLASSVRRVPSSLPSDASMPIPRAVYRNGRDLSDDSRDISYGESDDVVGELYSPRLRSQPSYFSVFSSAESRPSSSASNGAMRAVSRNGSVYGHGSYMESSFFPAWARCVCSRFMEKGMVLTTWQILLSTRI
jgi:hypothetical protein